MSLAFFIMNKLYRCLLSSHGQALDFDSNCILGRESGAVRYEMAFSTPYFPKISCKNSVLH